MPRIGIRALKKRFYRLAVARCRLQLQFHRLSAGEHCFLSSLARGEPFAAALGLGAAGDPGFDASAALQRFVAAEAIVDYRRLDPQDFAIQAIQRTA